jgi:hypothetical protein
LRRGLWQTLTPAIKLSKCWVFIRILLHVGTPRMGAILQRSVDKHPQEICLGNSHDHGTYP